ncbi:MAG: hypothetical protein ABI867_02825 [Kofleriaceae bacterium]
MRHLTILVLVFAAACGTIVSEPTGDDDDVPGDDDPGDDDPGTPDRCDRTRPFGQPFGLDTFNTNTSGQSPTLSLTQDELVAVVSENGQLLAARRSVITDEFPQPSGEVFAQINNGTTFFNAPAITADGLHAYFLADGLLFHAERSDLDSEFTALAQITIASSNAAPFGFTISADGQTVYAVDDSDGLLRSASASDAITFDTIRVDSAMAMVDPVLDPSQLRLYYTTGNDILVSTRASVDEPFMSGQPLTDINTTDFLEEPMFVSADDCSIVFKSDRPGHAGNGNMWQANRPFN